jgi:Protein of unknown function (DUF1064)
MTGYPGWREVDVGTLGAAKPANKFHARKTTLDGQTFDSAHEATVWQALLLEQQAGEIVELHRQRHFPLLVTAKDGLPMFVGRYTADFVCRRDGRIEVIDAKSRATRTEAYQLRKKLFEALYGLRIVER